MTYHKNDKDDNLQWSLVKTWNLKTLPLSMPLKEIWKQGLKFLKFGGRIYIEKSWPSNQNQIMLTHNKKT